MDRFLGTLKNVSACIGNNFAIDVLLTFNFSLITLYTYKLPGRNKLIFPPKKNTVFLSKFVMLTLYKEKRYGQFTEIWSATI